MKSLNNQTMLSRKPGTSLRNLVIGASLAAFLALFAGPVSAQKEGEERETKQTQAMSQQVYESLVEIQELVELEDFSAAQAKIREMQSGKKKMTPYETAQIWNLSGYTSYLSENYPEAIRAYEQVLAQPELPDALQQSTLKTLAQLHFTVEDYQKALDTVKRLMAVVPEPSADIFMLEGQAYFQLGKYETAVAPIKKAIDMNKAQGNVPRENWLLLLRVCYWELKDFPNMLLVLEELIETYPKDSYVLTLAGVYSELGDTKKQLALTEALYDKGYITGKAHAVNLANLYLLHGIPYKAAKVLEKEMAADAIPEDVRNLRLLSQAWYSAREDRKAIAPLKKAAAMSEDGELYIRLAQSYINLEEWPEAAEAASKALQLGGLKREDTANIMYGMALFNQKQFERARGVFQSAGRDQRSARASEQWIKYVDSEIRRRDSLLQKAPEAKVRDVNEMLKANTPPSGQEPEAPSEDS
jgi:tetratricopeptide (TPR) repeat protein